MIGAGAAQVERVGAARGDVEMPGVAVEGFGLGEVGNVQRDAAQAEIQGELIVRLRAEAEKGFGVAWTSCAVTAVVEAGRLDALHRRAARGS